MLHATKHINSDIETKSPSNDYEQKMFSNINNH